MNDKLIALTQIRPNGNTRRILLNSFNYMANPSGCGSHIYYGLGSFDVVESPEQIKKLIEQK